MWYWALAQGQDHLDLFHICPWDPAPKWRAGREYFSIKLLFQKGAAVPTDWSGVKSAPPFSGQYSLVRAPGPSASAVLSPRAFTAPVKADSRTTGTKGHVSCSRNDDITTTQRHTLRDARPFRGLARRTRNSTPRHRTERGRGTTRQIDSVWSDLASWPQLGRTYAVPVGEHGILPTALSA